MLRRLNDGRDDPRAPNMSPDPPVEEGAMAPDTPIRLQNGSTVPVQDIMPGQELEGGGEAFAVMQLWVAPETNLYEYHDMIVTEWTIVLDQGDRMWRHVKDTKQALLLGPAGNKTSWYQLWTTNHEVPVGEMSDGLVMADYHVIDEDDSIFTHKLQCFGI